MNRLPFFKRKQKSNSFEQLLTATAVKPAAINIDFTRSHIERGLRQWLFAQLKQDINLLSDAALTEKFFYESQDYIIRGLYGFPAIRSIQEIELTDASFKDYDNSCLHSITSIQFVFQYTVKASRTYTLRCTAVNSTRFGWQISQVTQI